MAEDLRARCEIDLSIDQLTAFAEQLAALGFLQPDDAAVIEDLPGFFPPLLADEAGDFSRPIFSSAAAARAAAPPGAGKTPATGGPLQPGQHARAHTQSARRPDFDLVPTRTAAG